MKTYRFFTTAHHDVLAENLEKAMEAFKEMEQEGLLPNVGVISRIEVKNEKGEYVPVDRPMRAPYPTVKREEQIGLSA